MRSPRPTSGQRMHAAGSADQRVLRWPPVSLTVRRPHATRPPGSEVEMASLASKTLPASRSVGAPSGDSQVSPLPHCGPEDIVGHVDAWDGLPPMFPYPNPDLPTATA